MDAFWRKGYEATSLADLCACTGLHKGSLYQAFGDKHQLFMRALEHYSNSHIQAVAGSAFTSDSPLENIRMVMRKMVDELEEGQGCLMINTLVELAPHDEEIRKALNKFGQQQLRLMTGLVEKAQQAGEIRSDEPADSIALRLMVMLAGIATTVRDSCRWKRRRALSTMRLAR